MTSMPTLKRSLSIYILVVENLTLSYYEIELYWEEYVLRRFCFTVMYIYINYYCIFIEFLRKGGGGGCQRERDSIVQFYSWSIFMNSHFCIKICIGECITCMCTRNGCYSSHFSFLFCMNVVEVINNEYMLYCPFTLYWLKLIHYSLSQIVEDFKRDPGPKLQTLLEKRAQRETNWVSK